MNHTKKPAWARGTCCVLNVLEDLGVILILIKTRSLKQHDDRAPRLEGGSCLLVAFWR